MVSASAPGKIVLLGEYAVLDGAEALVMAAGIRCEAEISTSATARCRLTTVMPAATVHEFEPGSPSGSALVDAVLAAFGAPSSAPWQATVDSSAFFASGRKLGLGSSAAALVAFAGALGRAAGKAEMPELSQLIQCHRDFQGGSGSGIDVAAALAGGLVRFRLQPDRTAQIGSVRLPKSVGFAVVFAGDSASTPNLVGQYRRWADQRPARADAMRQRMFGVAADGCTALAEGDDAAFVAAIDEYGRCLQSLGQEIGADLVTDSHRRIGDLAGEFGLAYKISGAGGGDVGLACGLDPGALHAFADRVSSEGFHVVPMKIDDEGLRVKEHAE